MGGKGRGKREGRKKGRTNRGQEERNSIYCLICQRSFSDPKQKTLDNLFSATAKLNPV